MSRKSAHLLIRKSQVALDRRRAQTGNIPLRISPQVPVFLRLGYDRSENDGPREFFTDNLIAGGPASIPFLSEVAVLCEVSRMETKESIRRWQVGASLRVMLQAVR